jgi:uncharacterized membrane protein (DUF4010 family)
MLEAPDSQLADLFVRVGVAVGLGLLVGLQREHSESKIAGIRTFPLIAALGVFAALLQSALGGMMIGFGALAVAATLFAGNMIKLKSGVTDPGVTTEMAALLVYAVGAYAIVGELPVAVAIGGLTAVLLHFREPLHSFVRRMDPGELRALMKFALIAMIILPVLPDVAYGPFAVFNPRRIWLMVVLIVGIGLVGHVAHRLFGARAGVLLGGLIGGLISSTATTVGSARKSKGAPDTAAIATTVILIASTVTFARVLVEVSAVAPGALWEIAPPLAAMGGLMAVLSGVAFVLGRSATTEVPKDSDPARLKSAVAFGALYAAVIFAVAATKHWFGTNALYTVAVISGLTDMDAITLSTAQLVTDGHVDTVAAWRVILIASLSNLVFKGAIAAALGGPRLTARIAPLFGLGLAGGFAILWLWPVG